ncbi:MAG: zinc ribbon domain-containing protein [Planctomycetaceae bacterium]|nr:zinc ribbon domain-containing protein [Planctomycetaceae bacterium]
MDCTHCGTQLEPGFKWCPGCGQSTAPTELAVPAAPRRFSRWVFLAVAATAVGVIALVLTLTRSPVPLDYGPAEAANLELTTAPGLLVEILPSAKSLAKTRFEAFDVSPSGVIIVRVDSRLLDMASGEELFTTPNPVQSFAFVGDALTAIDADGNLASFEEGTLHRIGKPPVEHASLAPASDHSRLFFYRNEEGWLSDSPALAAMKQSSIKVLTGSPNAITAVGGDAYQTLFATKNALFQVLTPGRPSLVLALPDPTQTILGVGIAGTATYFSTERAVYAYQDGIIVPLVLGLGGELRVRGGDVYVLDARQRRIYRIAPIKGGSS